MADETEPTGPWTRYQQQPATGPWTRYQQQGSGTQDLRPREGESREDYRARLAAAGPVQQSAGGQAMDAQALAAMEVVPRELPRNGGFVDNFLRPAIQGATFGFGDEITARLASIHPNVDYDQAIAFERAQIDRARAEHPYLATGSEMLGAVGSGLAAPIATAGNLGVRALQSAGIGAGMGGLYGIGTGEGGLYERALGARDDAALGGVIGGAIPLVGAAFQAGVNALRAPRASTINAMAGSTDDMRTAANALYAQADQVAGLPRSDFTTMANALAVDLNRHGMDEMLTPAANRVADNILDAATDPAATIGFREADILRRQAAIPAGNVANRTEASLGARMIEGIDDFIDNADPALGGILREARDIWGRLRRTELVDAAIERAGRAASGFENGLRVEFRRILNNPRLVRGFGADELAAMERVVSGTPWGNFLRQVGRLGIGLNGQSNALGSTTAAILGGTVGGPAGAVILPAIGTGAKVAANATTRGAAEFARSVTALGGLPYQQAITDAARAAMEARLRAPGIGAGLAIGAQ